MKRLLSLFEYVFFVIGIVLLLINTVGLFIPLRNPDIYKQETGFLNGLTMDVTDAYKIIDGKSDDTKKYVKEVTLAVSKTILHYWEDDKIDRFHMRVPWYENYIYFIYEKLGWMASPKYEFCNPKKALDRGVGVCSQTAMTLSKILDSKGIENKAIAFKEHVVVRVLVDRKENDWWILDPDYGVVLEADLDEIASNFALYRNGYEKVSYSSNDVEGVKNIVDKMGEIYKAQNYGLDMKLYIDSTCSLENRAYFLKWFFPLFFLSVSLLLHLGLNFKKRG